MPIVVVPIGVRLHPSKRCQCPEFRQTLLVASLLVFLWAIRLGGCLFRRILRMKVDHRFDGMRDEPLRFARFWLLGAITVAVVMLPVSLLDRSRTSGFGAWAAAGAAVWLAELLIEAVADAQKSAFRRAALLK